MNHVSKKHIISLPKGLEHLAGRIVDCDTHEMIPAQVWVSMFGPEVQEFADLFLKSADNDTSDISHPNVVGFEGDIAAMTPDIVNKKGGRVPAAADMDRRVELMDAMGVSKQLMYPTSVGLWATMLAMNDKFDPRYGRMIDNKVEKAKRWVHIYNEWMVELPRKSDRVRPVPPLLADTVEDLMKGAKAFIDKGIRAIWLPVGTLPGGKSPAHPALDPFWKLMTDTKTVVTLHVGTEGKALEAWVEWGNAPAFEGFRGIGEFRLDPWYWSVIHYPGQNFLSTMIIGGVFERHPELRVGVIEMGAHWIGPMMEQLDSWHEQLSGGKAYNYKTDGNQIPQKPSFYLKRNVRCTNMYFEKIDDYIDRYGLEDVLVFSTDYPHVEGGKDVFNLLYNRIERFGPDVVEKYFVKNGEFLFPA